MVDTVTLPEFVDAVVAGGASIVDVRERSEFVSGHVPGAVHIPLHLVPLRESEIRSGATTFVICETGARAYQAASYLERRGIAVRNVEGGMVAWRAAGLAFVRGEQS